VNPWCAYHQDTRLLLRPGLRRRAPHHAAGAPRSGPTRPAIFRQAAAGRWPGPDGPSSGNGASRTAAAGRLRFSSPGRGRTWLPGRPAPCSGITLSDAEVKKNACSPAQLDFGASDVCPPRTQTGLVVWCDRVQRRASCLDPDQGS